MIALILTACGPVRTYHGYLADEKIPSQVKPDEDTRSTVLAQLGSPSSTAPFHENVWFYMTTEATQFAYQRKRTKARTVVGIAFDESDVVSEVATYDLTDGQIIQYARRETPTRGRELGILEQVFGNIGALPSNLPGNEEGPGS